MESSLQLLVLGLSSAGVSVCAVTWEPTEPKIVSFKMVYMPAAMNQGLE